MGRRNTSSRELALVIATRPGAWQAESRAVSLALACAAASHPDEFRKTHSIQAPEREPAMCSGPQTSLGCDSRAPGSKTVFLTNSCFSSPLCPACVCLLVPLP